VLHAKSGTDRSFVAEISKQFEILGNIFLQFLQVKQRYDYTQV